MNRAIARCKTYALSLLVAFSQARAQEATIDVYADQSLHPVSRYLTGACIEDVNHEIYGGIDSQMIFGESFQEAAPTPALKGFTAFGGRWVLSGDSLQASGGDGPKLVSGGPAFADGQASVEIKFSDRSAGNAGLILKISAPGKGRDQFNGYEVALEPAGNLVLGRHRQNWEPIRRAPCDVFINEWNKLSAEMSGPVLELFVNGRSIIRFEDAEHPLGAGSVGLRTWQRSACFRNLCVTVGNDFRELPFSLAPEERWRDGVSGMWRPMRRGAPEGGFAIERGKPFAGNQSQRIEFTRGTGEIGIENQGLNRWGMNFVKNKVYEGCIWARATEPARIWVALESRDGERVYAERTLQLAAGDWQRLDFTLKPNGADTNGRLAINLKKPGSIVLGYALLQPGAWGRFNKLPVRRDVAEALINQGITVLRYGGSMVNHPGYRWKNMIGPRDKRPPYEGTWYPYSSNGWGIFDFLNFCEAAGFLAVPDLNLGESPSAMADFIEYVNGSPNSRWGRKRAADGHPKPYCLKYIEIGNEEAVNADFYEKFEPIAEAMWAKDPDIILVVGDFAYGLPIKDPFNFTGAAGRITSLAAHQSILRLAKRHDREVWFDIHTGTEGPRPEFGGALSYIDALDKISDGAKHRVVIFEFNANNHSQRRALANAAAINTLERDGRLPISTSANCLQPDAQNDNGWNQGLMFLNPSRVWLQPPGYVTQMISRNYQPLEVRSEVRGSDENLDVSARRSTDGRTLVLQVVNFGGKPQPTTIHLHGLSPVKSASRVEELAGALNAVNSAQTPERIKTVYKEWRPAFATGNSRYTFPAYSFTVLKIE